MRVQLELLLIWKSEGGDDHANLELAVLSIFHQTECILSYALYILCTRIKRPALSQESRNTCYECGATIDVRSATIDVRGAIIDVPHLQYRITENYDPHLLF